MISGRKKGGEDISQNLGTSPTYKTKPENETIPAQDLSQDMGSAPKTKPTAPPDHIISVITEDFQQAFFDDDMEEIQTLLR